MALEKIKFKTVYKRQVGIPRGVALIDEDDDNDECGHCRRTCARHPPQQHVRALRVGSNGTRGLFESIQARLFKVIMYMLTALNTLVPPVIRVVLCRQPRSYGCTGDINCGCTDANGDSNRGLESTERFSYYGTCFYPMCIRPDVPRSGCGTAAERRCVRPGRSRVEEDWRVAGLFS